LFGDFDGIDPEVQCRIAHFSRTLMRKLLHEPSIRLRSQPVGGGSQRMSDALRELFDLGGVSDDLSGQDGE
jgi:glutamyl-tRNA reductase